MNFNIFRAYDIRGIADTSLGHEIELTEEDAYIIGKAMGTYLHERYSTETMAVGRDVRLTSPGIQAAYIKGVSETGIKVTNVSMAVSPMLYWASCAMDFDSATNITASHNPKDYNGIKVVSKNAHSICGEEFEDIIKIIKSGHFKTVDNPPAPVEMDISGKYLEDLKNRIQMGPKKLKVVTDTGNGVAGPFAPKFLKSLGCEVIELYSEPDGTFPNHPSNPEEEANMLDLMAKVKETGADIGLGFDGDGDRVGIVDENGKMYAGDFTLLLLAKDVATRVKDPQIVFDVKVSQAIINELEKIPAKPIMHKTGHSFIERKMKELNAPLAGEISGHMFFGEDYFEFDDSLLAAGRIVKILSHSDKTLSQMFATVPHTFHTPEFKAACPDNRKFDIIDELVKYFTERYDCLTIDGVRIRFDENTWAGIRASNTSPVLTIRFEADTEEKLKDIQKLVVDKLHEYPEIDTGWYKG